MSEKLLEFREAQQIVLNDVSVLSGEMVACGEAGGRVLVQDFLALADLPGFDNSAMDGYAVRAADTARDALLEIIGTVAAGSKRTLEVGPGQAARIMTGAAIPQGADAIVPFEETAVEGSAIRLPGAVEAGQHVRVRGEDLAAGAVAVAAGRHLSPVDLGLISCFGNERVKVVRRPTVAVLATGDEIVSPGASLCPGQLYDCNTTAICTAIAQAGGRPVPLGIARDNPQSLRSKVLKGLESDMLITVAGASVGEFDLVRTVLQQAGVEEKFWGVSIKPGKPTAFCRFQEKPVFCLPGNPVSALVTFELFVRPALLQMTGCRNPLPEMLRLPLAEAITKKKARTLFARVQLLKRPEGPVVVSSGRQQTGILSSLARADGLAVLPDGQACFAAGERVEVILLQR
ncbi:MAG: molybdopterin molybdenumtransferase MoeA [Desulfuromonas sp.]|nr:MAG: molybdopterin molybdenumtransferase MoeA [Desulfuromonas sp.]